MKQSRISSGRRFALVSGFSLLLMFPWLSWGVETVAGDFQTILNARNNALVVWSYADNPDIIIYDFPNLTQQGRTFNRITQLTEQFTAPYKRVLTTPELNKYLESIRRTQADFAFGHDVLVSEMVLFYNLAQGDKIDLFPEELALRDFLVAQGLIKVWRGFYQAVKPDAVLLSIPQPQEKHDDEPRINDLARRAVFTHEISHGEFYTNQYYADYCRKFWYKTLDDNQRNAFKKFLEKKNYALNQEEMLVNEMQAYLMFTPDPNSISAAKLGMTDQEFEAMREAFRGGKPPTRLPMH